MMDHHSDDFSTARLDAKPSARDALREARATLYAVLERLEINDMQGEEQPFVQDCQNAISMIEGVLSHD